MNRFFNAIGGALLSLAVFSCAGCSDGGGGDDGVAAEFSQKEFSFPADGGKQEFTVKTTAELTLKPDAEWLTVGTSGLQSSTTKKYAITCQANTEAQERNTTIVVSSQGFYEVLSVAQAGKTHGSETGGDESAGMPDDVAAVVKAMGMGWNLGNNLDAHVNGVSSETSWGNGAATQATMNALREAGFRTVRIPVTWLGHIGGAPDYAIDADWLDRVAEVVGYAEKAGLNAIINIHHDGADSKYWLDIKSAATSTAADNAVKAQLKAMWTQIANKFADKGSFLIFEAMNEIHDGKWGYGDNKKDGKQYAALNGWNQVVVDAIRATGGENATRWIGVPGYVTNPKLTMEHLVLPTDPAGKLMVAVHFYDPNTYTLTAEYDAWGHLADASKGDKVADWGDESNVRTIFSQLNSKYVANGIPVYIGEIGCVLRATDRAEAFRKYYLEYVCKAAKTYGMAPIYWDNGYTVVGEEQSGIINHATGQFINNGADIAAIMVNAMESDDEAYTLESVYNNTVIGD